MLKSGAQPTKGKLRLKLNLTIQILKKTPLPNSFMKLYKSSKNCQNKKPARLPKVEKATVLLNPARCEMVIMTILMCLNHHIPMSRQNNKSNYSRNLNKLNNIKSNSIFPSTLPSCSTPNKYLLSMCEDFFLLKT